jgi:dGTPase
MHSIRVVEKLEKNGRGLNLTKEVREAIKNHSGLSNNLTGVNPETKILPFADKIAYLTSDLEDAKRFGVVTDDDIPKNIRKVLGRGKTDTINTLIRGIVSASFGTTNVKMDDEIYGYMCEFRNWMFENVYSSELINYSRREINNIMNYLCDYYEKNPDKMDFISEEDNLNRSVCDFVASLTDHTAIQLFNERSKIY